MTATINEDDYDRIDLVFTQHDQTVHRYIWRGYRPPNDTPLRVVCTPLRGYRY